MRCSKCGLENPPSAMRCDCGYDFESGQMRASYLSAEAMKKWRANRDLSFGRLVVWHSILNGDDCVRAIRPGFWSAVWVAGVTTSLGILSLFISLPSRLQDVFGGSTAVTAGLLF